MKTILLSLLWLIASHLTSAQARFEIRGNATTNIKPVYNKKQFQTVDTVQILLRLHGTYDSADAKRNMVKFDIQEFNLPNHPALVKETFSFATKDWPGNKKEPLPYLDTTIVLSMITNSITDTLLHDEVGHIIIKDSTNGFHAIRLTNSLVTDQFKYQGNKAFWIEIGSNFDLIDGLQPNNFFSGVFFHKRDIRPVFRKVGNSINKKYIDDLPRKTDVKNENLAVFAGIYEAKTITSSQEQNYSMRNYYDSSSFLSNAKDSIKVYKGIGTYVNQRVIRNVSLFFSPQVRLTNGSANEDGFHVFASLWFELQWQKIAEDKTFSQIRKQDSFNVSLDNIADYNPQSYKKEIDIRSHYLGVGLPVFFRETVEGNTVYLLLNPVVGLSNQPGSDPMQSQKLYTEGTLINRKWQPFYFVQFRLNEEKYGISFTGEVRGITKKNNPPSVTIALSKKFDLTKFIEYTK